MLLAPPDHSRKHGRGGAELGSSPAFPGRLCQTQGVPRGHSGPQGGLRAGVAAGRSLEALRKGARRRGGSSVVGGRAWAGHSGRRKGQGGREPRPREGAGLGEADGTAAAPTSRPISPPPVRSTAPTPGEACGQGSAGAWAHILMATRASAPNPVSMSHATPTPGLKPRGRAPGSGGKWSGIRASPGPLLEIVLGVTSELGFLSGLLLVE